MNKYESSLNILCDNCYHLKIERGKRCEWDGHCANYKRLKKLVEKDTPKSLEEIIIFEDDYHKVKGYKCQHCGTVHTNNFSNYCDECGQKLKGKINEEL